MDLPLIPYCNWKWRWEIFNIIMVKSKSWDGYWFLLLRSIKFCSWLISHPRCRVLFRALAHLAKPWHLGQPVTGTSGAAVWTFPVITAGHLVKSRSSFPHFWEVLCRWKELLQLLRALSLSVAVGVCGKGSVTVAALCDIGTFKYIHQKCLSRLFCSGTSYFRLTFSNQAWGS